MTIACNTNIRSLQTKIKYNTFLYGNYLFRNRSLPVRPRNFRSRGGRKQRCRQLLELCYRSQGGIFQDYHLHCRRRSLHRCGTQQRYDGHSPTRHLSTATLLLRGDHVYSTGRHVDGRRPIRRIQHDGYANLDYRFNGIRAAGRYFCIITYQGLQQRRNFGIRRSDQYR